jgi:acyl-CoA synthetase (AMP-forming)/AMP-acid ligase II
MIAQARAAVTHFRFTTADLGLLIMPLFHGHGMEQALTVPLLAGSGIVCPPVFEIRTFFENLARFRPTWYSAGFSHHSAILDAAGDYPKIVENNNLRYIRSGSGRLDPRVIVGLETTFGVPVIEGLGMSEVPCVTCNPLPPAKRKPGTVGIALDGNVEIMDDRGQLLGPNSEGQIVVRGSMVFEGYLEDPAATAAALVDGWYHTGDLGCLDDEGYLTIVGRIKELINRGGEKIRPGEVEVALMQHSDVKEAAAFPFPHPTLGEIVGAAIVPVTGTAPDRKDLMRFLADKLAPYKIPRDFTVLESLPKGRTGKIDRTALTRMHTTPVKIPA